MPDEGGRLLAPIARHEQRGEGEAVAVQRDVAYLFPADPVRHQAQPDPMHDRVAAEFVGAAVRKVVAGPAATSVSGAAFQSPTLT